MGLWLITAFTNLVGQNVGDTLLMALLIWYQGILGRDIGSEYRVGISGACPERLNPLCWVFLARCSCVCLLWCPGFDGKSVFVLVGEPSRSSVWLPSACCSW